MQIFLLIIAAVIVIGIIAAIWDFIVTILEIVLGIVAIIIYVRFYKITIPATGIFLVLKLIQTICKKLKEKGVTIGKVCKGILILCLAGAEIVLCIKIPKIGFTVLGIYILGSIFSRIHKNSKHLPATHKAKRLRPVTTLEIGKIIELTTGEIRKIDTPERRYYHDNMPWGRVNAFLNYFNRDINNEEPYYFRVIFSKIWNELREYGVVITDLGIYVSIQLQEKSGDYVVHDYNIPFAGLKSITAYENKIEYSIWNYNSGKLDTGYIEDDLWKFEVKIIEQIGRHIIEQGFPARMAAHPLDRCLNREVPSVKEINQIFYDSINKAGHQKMVMDVGRQVWDENKRLMGGSQGHGYGAEYANNTIDRMIPGKTVVNEAQQLENGHQVKNGADRIVNGVEIQTKYCRSPEETVKAYLNRDYLRSDGSGEPMALEVPRDQYYEVLMLLKKMGRDDVSVVRGHVTYGQAKAIAKSGTLQSLAMDAASGMIASMGTAGISTVITFAQAIWNGEEADKAMALSISEGVSILGKSAVVNVVTMQLMGRERNVVSDFTATVSEAIKNSDFASTSAGRALGIDKMTPHKLFGSMISNVIVFAPDVCRVAQGKISAQQFFKNSTVAGTSIAAGTVIGNAVIGQELVPIPFIGAAVGLAAPIIAGGVAGFVTKKMLDNFVEDDARWMFRYLKEEFLDVVMQMYLTEEEQNEVISNTICHPRLMELLQQAYMSGEYRRFVREGIVEAAVIQVLMERKEVTNGMMAEGLQKLVYN